MVVNMQTDYYTHRCYTLLNLIHHLGPISRKKLVQLTDYRPATVSDLCKTLIDTGLVIESGYLSMGQGRRRILLSVNKERLCAVGIAFSSSYLTVLVTQFDGLIIHNEEVHFSPKEYGDTLAKQIIKQISSLLEKFSDRHFVGVGIGEPLYGQVSYYGDNSDYSSFTKWIRKDLRQMLEQAFSFPVNCFNAVTLPALAEQRFGSARGCQDFFCVELSNGLSCSICCNGKVVSGSSGTAGKIGHIVVEANSTMDRLCYCGKVGCVERTAAFPAIAAEISKALDSGVYSVLNSFYDRKTSLRTQDIRRALDEGDQLCMRIVRKSANRIGLAIADAITLLNPERVILYGFMLELGEYFIREVRAAIEENVVMLSRNFELCVSSKLETILPLGAAAEMFTQFLRSEENLWIYQINAAEVSDESDINEDTFIKA